MATATLLTLVSMVRSETGHALTVSQGLNTVDSLKHLIRRTEYELWVAFQWPQLKIRAQVTLVPGEYKYAYPTHSDVVPGSVDMGFEQIREMWFTGGGDSWSPLEYGIPEPCIKDDGTNNRRGHPELWEDGQDDTRFRLWPTPDRAGSLRLVGMRTLSPLVDDTDYCTLDPTLISLFVSAELLSRAKAEDAEGKLQKAQRHLQKLLGMRVSAKHKVSTFGVKRGAHDYAASRSGLRPFIDWIP